MDQLMHIACKAGKILLESGAETYRVEDTMVKICEAYGAKEAHSFVLPTGIFLSLTQDGETYTQVVRVKNRAVDLNKIERINALSRDAHEQRITQEQFLLSLKEIREITPYPMYLQILLSGLCGAGFVFFYRGTPMDAVVAFISTILVKLVVSTLEKYGLINFLSNAVGGAVATVCAMAILSMGIGTNLNIIISSTIMILVPGVAITNAIRDSIAGDLVSGITKAVEAMIIAVSIALGTGAALSLWMLAAGGLI